MFGKKKKKDKEIIEQVETPIEIETEEPEVKNNTEVLSKVKEKPIKVNKDLRKTFERNTERLKSIKKSPLRVSER